jgi:hypothetical protein
MLKNLAVDIPGSDSVNGIFDWQSWGPHVWGVLAGLLVIAVALWFWRNMGSKVQLALVTILIIIVVALWLGSR